MMMSAPPNRALTLGVDPADRNWTEPEVTAAKEFTPPPMCMASISMPYLAKIPASFPIGMTLELTVIDPRATRIFSFAVCVHPSSGKTRIRNAIISFVEPRNGPSFWCVLPLAELSYSSSYCSFSFAITAGSAKVVMSPSARPSALAARASPHLLTLLLQTA